MHWLIYAILSPVVASSTNYIEKFLLEKELDDSVVFLIFMAVVDLLFCIPLFLLHGFAGPSLAQILILLLAGALNTFYVLPYFQALKLEETSRVVPLFQFVPVFTLVLSSFFLGEKLNSHELLGFALILFGGFFISVNKLDSKIFRPRKALWYMILSSLMYAILAVCFKFVVVKTSVLTSFSYEILGSALGGFILFCIPFYAKRSISYITKLSKTFYFGIVLNVSLSILFEFFSAIALSLAPVALVMVISGIQPFIVLLFGIILSVWFPHIIKEDIKKSTITLKISALCMIFIGIIFIYL